MNRSIHYTAIIELAAICFGCSGQKFYRRISIGLTNDNATDKIRDMEPLEDILIQYWLQCDVCLEISHHIHLKVPRTVPHAAKAHRMIEV